MGKYVGRFGETSFSIDLRSQLRIAVEDCLEQLRILYPDYNFSAVYGG